MEQRGSAPLNCYGVAMGCSHILHSVGREGASPNPALVPKILEEGHQFSDFLERLLIESRSERMSSGEALCHPYVL